MPIWLRKYTYNEISNFYKEESSAYERASQGGKGDTRTLVDSDGKVNKPAWMSAMKDSNIKKPPTPSYTTKMSRKS